MCCITLSISRYVYGRDFDSFVHKSNAVESQLQVESVCTMSDNVKREAGRFDLIYMWILYFNRKKTYKIV